MKLLSQHFRCTALGIYLWLYSCSLIAWPKLSCVYCTGKASGWFFRHEMSDLFLITSLVKCVPSWYQDCCPFALIICTYPACVRKGITSYSAVKVYL